MSLRYGSFALLLAGLCCIPVLADEKKPAGGDAKSAEFKATCPVSGAAAKQEQTAKYRDKAVYFCCEKCKAAYEAEPAKFSSKANLQLVQTGQFKQKQCPLSGGKTKDDQTVEVSGVKVAFCCKNCKGDVASSSKEDQLKKVFADDVFAKSFEAKK
ncbi:MAG: hypothetical protein ACK58L_19650 [Planctomycetota bacterium]